MTYCLVKTNSTMNMGILWGSVNNLRSNRTRKKREINGKNQRRRASDQNVAARGQEKNSGGIKFCHPHPPQSPKKTISPKGAQYSSSSKSKNPSQLGNRYETLEHVKEGEIQDVIIQDNLYEFIKKKPWKRKWGDATIRQYSNLGMKWGRTWIRRGRSIYLSQNSANKPGTLSSKFYGWKIWRGMWTRERKKLCF